MSRETDAIWEYLKTLNLDTEGGGGMSWEDIYPIGTIYQTEKSPQEFDPNTVWGGTWIQLHGRFLVAEGNNSSSGDDALNLNAGATGGKTDAIVPYHRHGIPQLTTGGGTAHHHSGPSHRHEPNTTGEYFLCVDASPGNARFSINSSGNRYTVGYTSQDHFHGRTNTGAAGTGNTGDESAHTHNISATNTNYEPSSDNKTKANLPPYLAVYMWKRTA